MHSKLAFFIAFAVAGSSGAAVADTGVTTVSADESSERLTVASYNIHARRYESRATADAIAALDADIIVLQEVSRPWLRRIERLHKTTHPHRAIHIDDKYYGGLAVLSQHPIRDAEILRTDAGRFPAWRGLVDTPGGPVQLINVHLFPPIRLIRKLGLWAGYRKSQELHVLELEGYWPHLSEDLPTIIAGDFNEDIRGRGIVWLGERGFVPAHDGVTPTWRWTLKQGVEVEYQLDHILIRGLDAVDARVVDAGSSDHLPIAATLVRSAQR